MGNELRRREMVQSKPGVRTVVMRDVTVTGSGDHFTLAQFTQEEVNSYNQKQPDRIIFRLYLVAADTTIVNSSGRICIWHTGGVLTKQLCSNSSTGKIGFNYADGQELTCETIMTLVNTKSYTIETNTNSGARFTAGAWTFNMTNKNQFRIRDLTNNRGPGSRGVLLFEYDE